MLRRKHVLRVLQIPLAGIALFGLWFLLSLAGCKKEETEEMPPCIGERLEPGHEVTQRVWGGRCDFDYEGKAGEVITLKVVSKAPGLDPQVELLDPEGGEEASDDDSGGKGNPLIASHALKRSGRYTISIGSSDGRSGELSVLLVRTKGSGL